MTKPYFWLACALCAGPALAQPQNTVLNLVQNGDFELNPKNETPPQSWYFYGAPDAAKLVRWDLKQKHAGEYSLQLTNTRPEDYPNIFQDYKLAPGKYKFSGWVKGESLTGTNVSDQGVSIYIEMYDNNGNWSTGEYPAGISGTIDWTKIEGTFTVTDKTVKQRLGLYLRKGTTGTAWFDDLTIQKTE